MSFKCSDRKLCVNGLLSSPPAHGAAITLPPGAADTAALRKSTISFRSPTNAFSGVDNADFVLSHPNQYYEKSRELRTGEKAAEAGTLPSMVAASGGGAKAPDSPPKSEVSSATGLTDAELAAMMDEAGDE